MNFINVLLLIFSIIHCFYLTKCEDSVIVKTKLGSIKGTVAELNGKKINQFLGIPYAEPPVGVNRFGKPKPIEKYNETVDATHKKNVCWMTTNITQMPNQSEDCLFLNIFSENKTDNKLRPVMFWIYGGGLVWGDGYVNGKPLSSLGVVIVGFNYRLSAFGFLYANDSTAPGNVGIYDQIEALKWVHNNIEHFGGDPKQITIFGQSAGSSSVSALIVSPLSRNLFKRAILESGAHYGHEGYNNTLYLNEAKKISESVGCLVGEDNKWLDCLREVNATKLVEHQTNKLIFGTEILPNTLEDALKTGKYQTGIEVIAGAVSNEGTLMVPNDQFKQKLNNISYHITKEELKTQIKLLFESNGDSFVDKLYDYYVSKVDESDQILIRKAYTTIFGDRGIKCSTYLFAKKLAQISAENKVRSYTLTYKSIHGWCPDQEWKGVCHGDDLLFVWGEPIQYPGGYPEVEREFSAMIEKIWTNFAKTGNPLPEPIATIEGKNVTDWPTFRETDQSPIVPKVMELNPKNFGHILTDPYHDDCDGVWKQYFGVE